VSDGAIRLDILKALGDNTRYAIYLELARSPLPRSTAQIADVLGLHANTVRPHLERMREVGLLEVRSEAGGGVGRPQHLYSLAPDAPSLGLEPPPFPMLARVLLEVAHTAGLDASDLGDAGRVQGRADADRWSGEFDPEVVDLERGAVMAFAHCPFRELADRHPDLVCALHQGLVEGLVDGIGRAEVVRFHPLLDRTPCQVELAVPGGSD
jgi:predicted ArsR family transcriptional regulator